MTLEELAQLFEEWARLCRGGIVPPPPPTPPGPTPIVVPDKNFTTELRTEYNTLYSEAIIRSEYVAEIQSATDRILSPTSLQRYKDLESTTTVPWYVIGILHSMESSNDFTTHLHNGDPLSDRTVNTPAGRPLVGDPPFTFEISAIDALEYEQLSIWPDWTTAGVAFVLERWNGFGYRRYHPVVKSPFLWSYTTIYTSGRYVADGKWSDTAVSKQPGGMAILKNLIDLGHIP